MVLFLEVSQWILSNVHEIFILPTVQQMLSCMVTQLQNSADMWQMLS